MIVLRNPPALVAAILRAPPTLMFARLALISAYVLGGLTKAFDFPAAVAEQAHFGLRPPAVFAFLTIMVELLGSALVMTRRWVWLGAGMLGLFTAAAAVVANAFWTMGAGPGRFEATNAFFEHLGLVGGFAVLAVLTHGERPGPA